MSKLDEARDRWSSVGIAAYFCSGLVALLVFGGVDIVANAMVPGADGGGIVFGSILLGLASGIAVLGVILAVRRAALPEPPAIPRPSGRVEL